MCLKLMIQKEINTRYPTELKDILKAEINSYRQSHKLCPAQDKAVEDIILCRSKELGGHIKQCNSCDYTQQSYNSCRNRHCPKCQFVKQEQWVDKLTSLLLPCKYFHVVFTLPQEILPIVLLNPRQCYTILFKSSSKALLKAALNPDFLGAQVGALSVLHTWTQTLGFHPHIHMLVPAGGLSLDGMEWKLSKKKFFLPGKALSRIFRREMINQIEQAINDVNIKLPDHISSFTVLKHLLYQKDWNVYLKKAFGGVNSVLKYLGRYTHRVAISNSRILSFKEGKVSFRYKDNKDKGKNKVLVLESNEFIRRFLQHILPNNFYKIRYTGILAPAHSKTKRAQSASLISERSYLPQLEGLVAMEVVELITGNDPYACPKCQKGRLTIRIRDAG